MDIAFADQEVRLRVYSLLLETGTMPKVADLAASMKQSAKEIKASLKRLYAAKALALMHESGEILMASPSSAVPTSYFTDSGGKTWWANCAWDALAIPAAMHMRGKITASCACCGEGMNAEVENRRLISGSGVVHIALPAKQWWDDIHFT